MGRLVAICAFVIIALASSCQRKLRFIDDVNGEIETVLVTRPFNPNDPWSDIDVSVCALADSMSVMYAFLYSADASGFQAWPDTVLNDSLDYYLNWLRGLGTDIVDPVFVEQNEEKIAWFEFLDKWERFQLDTARYINNHPIEQQFWSKLSSAVLEADEIIERSYSKWVKQFKANCNGSSNISFHDLKYYQEDDHDITMCSCRVRKENHGYAQDLLNIVKRGNKSIAQYSCCGRENDQAFLLSKMLKKHKVVQSFDGIRFSISGGNVVSNSQLSLVADQEIIDSPMRCTEQCSGLEVPSYHELKKFLESDYDGVSAIKVSNGAGGLNINGREISIPFYHLDLFLNFGVDDTVYLGEFRYDFFNNAPSMGSLRMRLDDVTKRLNEVAEILNSLSYKVIRVPLIPINNRSVELDGVYTFNNCLMELDAASGKRTVYLPDYQLNSDNRVNWKTLLPEVKKAYHGWNVKWIPGRYVLGNSASLRCYVKVVSREKVGSM